jgi:hypothetical protein
MDVKFLILSEDGEYSITMFSDGTKVLCKTGQSLITIGPAGDIRTESHVQWPLSAYAHLIYDGADGGINERVMTGAEYNIIHRFYSALSEIRMGLK